MFPIVSFVGRSNSGKTTVLEKLIPELKRRGYRIGVVKHTTEFDLDRRGKDSWRFSQAGSDMVAISSPDGLALLRRVEQDLTLDELLHLIGADFDILFIEGFKESRTPKIEVHRKGVGELLFPPDQLLGIVTDEPLEVETQQYSFNDIEQLANFIEQRFLAQRDSEDIALFVNGTPVSPDLLPKGFITATLLGMLSTINVNEFNQLNLWFRRNRRPVSEQDRNEGGIR